MPTPTKYTYGIIADTPNDRVNPTTLESEIDASAIVTALDFIETAADVLDIWFKDPLSGGDQTLLTAVVNAHQGNNIPVEGDPAQTQRSDFKMRTRRFGNAAPASVSEALVAMRAYVEPASQAQRSVKSSSTSDTAAGAGAKAVRIVYLDSAYVQKSEDVTMNGLVAVNTVATDIRFVQDMYVIQGASAVGAISLMTLVAGAGTEICGIGAGQEQAFFAHHYVPAGKQAWLAGWGVTTDDECSFKLKGQKRFGANLVDFNLDLENLRNGNLTPPNRLTFERFVDGVLLPEKTYVRITAVPAQATSTVIRAWIYLLEESL